MQILYLLLISQIPAFPGASGSGAVSAGGRGGRVLVVNSLEDAGYGTLRWALEDNSGPRTVVFRVSGEIILHSPIRIDSPYVTIAGQTAPGSVVIRGDGMDYALLEIRTHDVIIRYLSFRPGHGAPDCSAIRIDDFDDGDSIYSVILDHISISWNTDEGVSIYGSTSIIRNITIQNSLLAEPLSSHPTTLLTGGNVSGDALRVGRVDYHHNLLMNTGHRNPLVKTPSIRFVNNIVYNWYFYAFQAIGGVQADVVGNYFRPGPLDSVYHNHSVEVASAYGTDAVDGYPSIYMEGNVGPYNSNPDADNWSMVYLVSGENGVELGPAPDSFRRDTPLTPSLFPIGVFDVEDLEDSLLDNVGNSGYLDEMGRMVPFRDSVDSRLIDEYMSGSGCVPDSEEQVGGFPLLPDFGAYPDGDGDGMSDTWEMQWGLDPSNPLDASANDLDAEYTNLEVFLNGMKPVPVRENEDYIRGVSTGIYTPSGRLVGRGVEIIPSLSPGIYIISSPGAVRRVVIIR